MQAKDYASIKHDCKLLTLSKISNWSLWLMNLRSSCLFLGCVSGMLYLRFQCVLNT